jgi:hypothetical protein
MKPISILLFSIITISIANASNQPKKKKITPKIDKFFGDFMIEGKNSKAEKAKLLKAISLVQGYTFDGPIKSFLKDPNQFLKLLYPGRQMPAQDEVKDEIFKAWNVEWDKVEDEILNYITVYAADNPKSLKYALYKLKFGQSDLAEMLGTLTKARQNVFKSIVDNMTKLSESPTDFRPLFDMIVHVDNIISNVFTSKQTTQFFVDLLSELKRIRESKIIPGQYGDVLEVLNSYYNTLLKSLYDVRVILKSMRYEASKKY